METVNASWKDLPERNASSAEVTVPTQRCGAGNFPARLCAGSIGRMEICRRLDDERKSGDEASIF
jgi:hypothetical protein